MENSKFFPLVLLSSLEKIDWRDAHVSVCDPDVLSLTRQWRNAWLNRASIALPLGELIAMCIGSSVGVDPLSALSSSNSIITSALGKSSGGYACLSSRVPERNKSISGWTEVGIGVNFFTPKLNW